MTFSFLTWGTISHPTGSPPTPGYKKGSVLLLTDLLRQKVGRSGGEGSQAESVWLSGDQGLESGRSELKSQTPLLYCFTGPSINFLNVSFLMNKMGMIQ